MAPYSSTLAWKIPWAEEPGRLQSMGSWERTSQLHALEAESAHYSLSQQGEGPANRLLSGSVGSKQAAVSRHLRALSFL